MTRADGLILAGHLAFSLALGYLSVESSIATPWVPLVLLGVAGAVCIALHSRFPRAMAGSLLVLLIASAAWGTGAESFAVIAVLFRWSIARPARQAWMLLAAVAVSGGAAAILLSLRLRVGPPLLGLALRADADGWPSEALGIALAFTATALIACLIGLDIGHRRRHVAILVERAERMRRERDQQASIQAGLERERIAREIHDVIAHSLSVMVTLADGAGAAAVDRPEEARTAIARVADTGRRTLGEVRRLLTQVRGDDDGQHSRSLPGLDQLDELIDEFRVAGLPIRFERAGALDDADPALGLTIYRIVQEALTNVLRHAREVRDVRVRLDLGGSLVQILVEDSSAPASAADQPGRGLVGIRERTALYGGTVETGPRPGGGWRVLARLDTEETT